MPAKTNEVLLLRGADQLITLHGPAEARRGSALEDLRIIPDGAVLIEDGRIAGVGSTRRLENLKAARGALEIDVGGCVVMPGFVDCGLSASLERPDPSKKSLKKPIRVYEETLQLMRSCLEYGTLTAEVKAKAADLAPSTEMPVLRQLAKIGDSPIGLVRTWKLSRNPESSEDIDDFGRKLGVVSRNRLAHFLEMSAADDVALSPAFLGLLRDSRLGVKIAWSGDTQRTLATNITSVEPFAIVCPAGIHFSETRVFARYPGTFVFPPGQESTESTPPGIRQAIDAGAAVALCSGYETAHGSGFSMQTAVSTAVLRGELTPEEAISAATVNAAYALGVGHQAGTLEAGKRADILVLGVPDYREITKQSGVNNVAMVLRNGDLVYNRSRWRIGAHERVSSRMRP